MSNFKKKCTVSLALLIKLKTTKPILHETHFKQVNGWGNGAGAGIDI